MAGGAGGQPGVLVGGGGAGGVGDQVGPGSTAIDGDLDLVAGDDTAAVVDRSGPREVDRVGPAGGCREARRDFRGDGRLGGVVDDGGDAVHAGGEGRGVVAAGVLDGQGVVARGGVGVGDDDDLALADADGKRERERDTELTGHSRQGNAVCGDREGGVRGPYAHTPFHKLGEPKSDSPTVRENRGAAQRGRGGVHLHHDVEYVADQPAVAVIGGHFYRNRLHIRSRRRPREGPRGGVEAQPGGQHRVVGFRRRVDQRVAAVGVGERGEGNIVDERRPHRRHLVRDRDRDHRGVVGGGAGGGIDDLGGSAGADAVDGRDAVAEGGAGGQPGVLVGGGGAGSVGDLVGPGGAAIGGDLDLVAGDDTAAVVDRGGP